MTAPKSDGTPQSKTLVKPSPTLVMLYRQRLRLEAAVENHHEVLKGLLAAQDDTETVIAELERQELGASTPQEKR